MITITTYATTVCFKCFLDNVDLKSMIDSIIYEPTTFFFFFSASLYKLELRAYLEFSFFFLLASSSLNDDVLEMIFPITIDYIIFS